MYHLKQYKAPSRRVVYAANRGAFPPVLYGWAPCILLGETAQI